MPVSWQMGPSSSCAISILARMMLNACEDCVPGVSLSVANDMAARTSGGRLVEVWVISSSRLDARNSMKFHSIVAVVRIAPFFLLAALASAQDRAEIERFTASRQRQILSEFVELLSIPNVAI